MDVERGATAQLRESCDKLQAEAQSLWEAARDRAAERLRAGCRALTATAAAHVEIGDASLSKLMQRRLRHDHNRLLQLTRSLSLAAESLDAAGAETIARRLREFVVEHVRRELSP